MSSFNFKSATNLARLIRTKKISSLEVVTAYLDQIKKYNQTLNALILVFEKEALELAIKADEALLRNEIWGPLHGVPVTIKESIWTKGHLSNLNSKLFEKFIAPDDAIVVQKLKQSGAIIIGKSNVPFMLQDYQTSGEIYPACRNPYNFQCSPGGSTGGGAAALAAGMSCLELGSDFAGSIRIPAAFCGLVSLKPTDRTIITLRNSPEIMGTEQKGSVRHMAQISPIARSVEDVELLWNIIKGGDESDRTIPPIKWEKASRKKLKDYKIAWTNEWDTYKISKSTNDAMNSFIEKISLQGCDVTKKIPEGTEQKKMLELFCYLFGYVIGQDVSISNIPRIKENLRNGVFNKRDDLVDFISKALDQNFRHYAQTLSMKNEIVNCWEMFFKEYDFFICPVSYGTAFKSCKTGENISYEGESLTYIDYCLPYVSIFSATGHPAMVIPIGFIDDDLPVSIQIVGKYWSENELFHFVKQISKLTNGFIPPKGYC